MQLIWITTAFLAVDVNETKPLNRIAKNRRLEIVT